jgi:S1-C subfamily serine protease
VFGSEISKPAFDKLVSKHTTWNARYGRGGFLGIGGTSYRLNEIEGCIVSQVTPNEAASIAGIRRDDVITAYNGRPVSRFIPANRDFPQIEPTENDNGLPAPSLSELIGENAPGDRVKVTILRGEVESVMEVVLGEWP